MTHETKKSEFFFSSSGETLLEAIIAISIFAIIVGPASATYVSSIQTVATNRNDLVAAALADEGVEMVRNMRDTNLLRFSPKAQECWNTLPEHLSLEGSGDPPNPTGGCDNPDNKIGNETSLLAQQFRLTFDPDALSWKLVAPSPADAHLNDPFGDVADENAPEQYRLRQDETTGIYFAPETLPTDVSRLPGRESILYRQITIQYLNLSGGAPPYKAMKVTSLVQYRSGSRLRTLKRIIILTNQPST